MQSFYVRYVKRVIDFIAALVALVILSPVLLVVTFLLWYANKGKAFFFQQRIGKNERVIRIIKFKSMTDEQDATGNLLPDNARLTPMGAFVRKTSLDELPQLINVLRGDMSLVGPRPLLPKYLPLYSEEQRKRHLVQPGITGWAQVNGRNSISWTEKFRLDVYYQEHVSLWLDIRVILLTIQKVLKREGVNQTAERPMMPFNGSN